MSNKAMSRSFEDAIPTAIAIMLQDRIWEHDQIRIARRDHKPIYEIVCDNVTLDMSPNIHAVAKTWGKISNGIMYKILPNGMKVVHERKGKYLKVGA